MRKDVDEFIDFMIALAIISFIVLIICKGVLYYVH